ncbi:MAG: sensor domain-containing protein [Pseudomonadota bacterium]
MSENATIGPDHPESLADKLTDFLARLAPTGTMAYVSQRGAQWLGRPALHTRRGTSLFDLVVEDDHARLREALELAVVEGPQECSVRLVDSLGNELWVNCRLFTLFQRGAVVELLLAAWNIAHFKLAEAQLDHVVLHDALTGLANRTLLMRQLEDMVCAPCIGEGFAVIHVDLDGFKKVNDALGHEAGDRIIMDAAERLKALLRTTDLVARIGGDEFVLVLPGTHELDAVTALARKLLNAFQKPYDLARNTLHLTASMGIALYPDHGTDAQQLLKHADIALAKAKEQGRNRFQVHGPEGAAVVEKRVRLEGSMYDAIQNGEFELHYQPLFDAGRGTVAGVEALIRWHRPGQGMIPPAEFIPIAEDSGLINFLGKWALRVACHQVADWNTGWGSHLTASVNVSPRQFHHQDLVAMVESVLQESGLAPDCLSLEITEGALMHNPKAAEPVLDRLRSHGIGVSVDDFGTGYSSLAYLKRFPLTTLKIDYSFVRDLTTDANDRAIVSMIVGLAREMELRVVAEGVETEAQLAFLRAKGCDLIQGFLLGRPVPAAELAEKIETGSWKLN